MFITVFLYGFIFMSHNAFMDAVDKYWKISLAVGVSLSIGISVTDLIGFKVFHHAVADYIFGMIIRGINIWCCLIGITGFGKRFLNSGGRFIKYASQGALPFYIIHMTFVTLTGFYIIALPLPVAGKYSLIIIFSFISAAIFYECFIRRFNGIRFFFGLKRK
jgi:glucans biosynthesis protein C